MLKIRVSRPGAPVHEVYRPRNEPSVLEAAARLVMRFADWNAELQQQSDPLAGSESVFLGQMHSGEIYNQFPQECRLEGTRRWLPNHDRRAVEADYRAELAGLTQDTGAMIEGEFILVRDAFQLDPADAAVAAFDTALAATCQTTLPRGGKPFVDDCNTFWSRAGIPSITHGPRGGGAHTLNEWVSIDDLVRVAHASTPRRRWSIARRLRARFKPRIARNTSHRGKRGHRRIAADLDMVAIGVVKENLRHIAVGHIVLAKRDVVRSSSRSTSSVSRTCSARCAARSSRFRPLRYCGLCRRRSNGSAVRSCKARRRGS